MVEDLNYPNLEKICRLCLKEEKAAVEIFPPNGKNESTFKQLSIPMRIMACAALEVQSGDGLPKCICTECRYQLEMSFYFRKRAQLADSKLRKHIRLLTAGRKSLVFLKNDDEEDDDELEFEDSINFIREHEDKRIEVHIKNEQNLRLEFEKEMQQQKLKFDETLKQQLKEQNENLKRIWEESNVNVRNEVEQELRKKLRIECLDAAKSEVYCQVQEQCRQEQLEVVLDEIEIYLREKRPRKRKMSISFEKTNNDDHADDTKNHNESLSENRRTKNFKIHKTPAIIRNTRKRLKSPEISTKVEPATRMETISVSYNTKDNVSEIDFVCDQLKETEPYEVIANDNDIDNDNDDDNDDDDDDDDNTTQSNFYIVDDDTYIAKEGNQNYPIIEDLNDLNTTDTAFYQIEANGEIQTVDGKTNDIIYYKVDAEDDVGDVDDMCDEDGVEELDLEFVSLNVETRSSAASKKKDLLNQEGFKKYMRKDKNDTKQAPVVLKQPFSRPTDTPKTFKCASCPMSFSTINTLNRHYRTHKRAETKGTNYTCSQCHVIFSCKSALNRHAVIHTGQRPYKCDECGKSFVQREILKRHQQVHTGERPHQCPHCTNAYTQKVNLIEHINQKHSKVPKLHQHKCHLCEKRFNHASGLSRHLTSHSGITYECMKCNRNFNDRSSVKRHLHMVHKKDEDDTFIKERSPEKMVKIES